MRYYDLMKDLATKFNLRLEIVLCAQEHGVSEAARADTKPLIKPSGNGAIAIKPRVWTA